MNMIFDKICEKLKTCKEMKTNEEREKFEEEIEIILQDSFKEYDAYSKKYLEKNQQTLQLDKHNMKSLMLEYYEVKTYDEENYPFYKYFLMTTYPSKDMFINKLKNVIQFESKYPLLTFIITEDNQKYILKYLPDFNKFVNFMIEYYSYKISREEASKRLIKNEEIYINNKNGFKDKFNKFIKIWKYLKPYSTKYMCRNEMPPIDLDENKSIAYFLNDDGEMGKGMYIGSAYENFIEIQNSFLERIIESLKQKGISNTLIKNIERRIDVQEAGKNEIINFDKINAIFMEAIYENSRRNIFSENNNINFMNYSQYIYNFDSIEKYLVEILLPGIAMFKDIKDLKFVTYCFEGFRGNNSIILPNFFEAYKQISLSIEKKQILYDLIKDKMKNENKNDLLNILFSIQLLISYLTRVVKKESDEIELIIEELPNSVELSKECIEFFKKQKLKISELSEVYSYIELLCFNPIVNNLREYYKKKINIDVGQKILKSFEGNNLKNIKKIYLASACRKFISRYLVGKREDTDYNENNKLYLYLNREDIWPIELWKNEEIIEQYLEIIKREDISVGQSYELYNLLGGDENLLFESIKI